jgi:hypothetical protein
VEVGEAEQDLRKLISLLGGEFETWGDDLHKEGESTQS